MNVTYWKNSWISLYVIKETTLYVTLFIIDFRYWFAILMGSFILFKSLMIDLFEENDEYWVFFSICTILAQIVTTDEHLVPS